MADPVPIPSFISINMSSIGKWLIPMGIVLILIIIFNIIRKANQRRTEDVLLQRPKPGPI